MFDSNLKATIKSYAEKMTATVNLVLNETDKDQLSDAQQGKRSELVEMLSGIASATDKINFSEAATPELRNALSFKLQQGDKDTGIAFSGIPSGHEFNSLILAILQSGGVALKLEPSIQNMVRSIKAPLKFEIAVSLSCHNCPEVVQALNQFALLNDQISSEMVDGGLYPEWIEQNNIQGVPSVFLNGKPFANGKVEVGGLLEKLSEQYELTDQSSAPMQAQDVVVIGGGPAGVAAAIYTARKGFKTTIVADRLGGQVKDTLGIENLISVPKTTGPELTDDLKAHLKDYEISVKEHLKVAAIEPGPIEAGKTRKIKLSSGEEIASKSLIIATGANWRKLGVPGEDENIGNGVAYCPHCDGPFFKGKDVAVIGGGNSGVEAALDLAGIVKSVTLVEFLPELKADQVLVDQLEKRNNIRVIKNTATQEIKAENGKVVSMVLENREDQGQEEVPIAGIFIQIGLVPNSGFLQDLVEKNPYGEIIINDRCETSEAGIFAAGDVTTVPYKQINISMGEGSKAALSAFDYLMKAG